MRKDLFSRLARMSWDELQTRSRQELSKRLDSAGYRPSLIQNGYRDGKAAKFFFNPTDIPAIIAALEKEFPGEKDRILREAESICSHKFDLLGYQRLDFGKEIDWHLDAVNDKRAPILPWPKVRYLDFNTVGDHKITWELNRHQHLVTLAKAYHYTGDNKFTKEILDQWYDWRSKNPYPLGINWASSLEVAFRSLSWIWLKYLLIDSRAISQDFRVDLDNALALNGWYINRYLSTVFSPNTHLLGEAVALFFIGLACPQYDPAEQWKNTGWEVTLRQAELQVQSDGIHFEQSIYYHVYALDFFLHARILAAANGIVVPESFDRQIMKMLSAMSALAQGCALPRMGDDDGGRLFDPRRNQTQHMFDPLATGAVLYKSGDYKFSSRGICEETLWLLGPRAIDEFKTITSVAAHDGSTCLNASGIYKMTQRQPLLQELFIDAGPQGTGTSGHGHADALSIQLFVDGDPLLIDSGTYRYISDDPDRGVFRGTAAHNTVRLDGVDQAEPTSPFSWRDIPTTEAEIWITGETFDLFRGNHTGYLRLANPARHVRWVFSLKSRFSLVRDLILGEGSHHIEIYWHAAPDLACETVGSANILKRNSRDVLAILPSDDEGWLREVIDGEWSPAYGRKEPNKVIRYSVRKEIPSESATLLLPSQGDADKIGIFKSLGDLSSTVKGYCYSGDRGNEYFFFAEQAKGWEINDVISDARFLYLNWKAATADCGLVMCDGSYVEISGHRLVDCAAPVTRFEFFRQSGASRSFCSDKTALRRVEI